VPVVKRRKNAQEEEEDETYEQVSGSDEEETDPEEEVLEEEEEEVQFESDSISNDEEELPSTSKSLKDVAMEKKKTGAGAKRKIVPEKKGAPTKKVKIAGTEKIVKRVVKKPAPKTTKEKSPSDDNKKTSNTVEYNDKNVDFNLYNEAPEHIKNVKIKISSNVVMICRMIEATGNTSQGLTYDYAALSFVRQSKNGRAYEFNLPLTLAPSITKGINLMIRENTKFFSKHLQKINVDENE
jgi:hypothetical protein